MATETIFSIQEKAQFGNLELLANQVVEGFITGLHRSPFHGFSVEFAEHRLYNEGESTKHIDWKLYARTDKLFVKRYEEETNLRCQMLIDCSASMLFPFPKQKGLNKLSFSAFSAAALVNLLKRQRDAAGITLFDSEMRLHTPAKLNLQHQQFLYSELDRLVVQDDFKPQKQAKTVLSDTLHKVAESIPPRSMVVVFSDFFDENDNEEILSALQHLRYNKHEVVVFHVVDKKREVEFDFKNRPYKFVDLETGEMVKLTPQQVKDYYKKKSSHSFDELKLKCGQYSIDFEEADINKPFDQILLTFLLKRNKLLTH